MITLINNEDLEFATRSSLIAIEQSQWNQIFQFVPRENLVKIIIKFPKITFGSTYITFESTDSLWSSFFEISIGLRGLMLTLYSNVSGAIITREHSSFDRLQSFIEEFTND